MSRNPKTRKSWAWQESFNLSIDAIVTFLETKVFNIQIFKRATFTGTQDGSNKVFILDYELESGSEQIFIGGAFLCNQSSEDYTISAITLGGAMTKLEFVNAPYSTDKITIFGVKRI